MLWHASGVAAGHKPMNSWTSRKVRPLVVTNHNMILRADEPRFESQKSHKCQRAKSAKSQKCQRAKEPTKTVLNAKPLSTIWRKRPRANLKIIMMSWFMNIHWYSRVPRNDGWNKEKFWKYLILGMPRVDQLILNTTRGKHPFFALLLQYLLV